MRTHRFLMSGLLFVAGSLCPCLTAYTADVPGDKGTWTVISDSLVPARGKNEKTAGIAVDRTTGDVLVLLNNCGELYHSSDKGTTFRRIDGGKLDRGRCETGWGLNVDPNDGRHIACFAIYGTGGLTLDGGATWSRMPGPWDYGAVDWSAADPKVMLAARHESRGQIHLSKDGGRTWTQATTGVESRAGSSIGIGVVDAGTLLLHRKDDSGIERSTDDGATWMPVSPLNPKSRVAVVFRNTVYWVGAEGLIVSKDKGKTWQVQGTAVDAIMGPLFGKDENHVVVVGRSGFSETTDGGKTWKLVLPLSSLDSELDRHSPIWRAKCMVSWFDHFAWDPIGNVFYHAKMYDAARKYQR